MISAAKAIELLVLDNPWQCQQEGGTNCHLAEFHCDENPLIPAQLTS